MGHTAEGMVYLRHEEGDELIGLSWNSLKELIGSSTGIEADRFVVLLGTLRLIVVMNELPALLQQQIRASQTQVAE